MNKPKPSKSVNKENTLQQAKPSLKNTKILKSGKKPQTNPKEAQDSNPQSEKIIEIEQSGLFDAFEQILRSLHNGGHTDINVFDFAANRLVLYEAKCKTKLFKNSRLENYKKGIYDSKNQLSQLNEPIPIQPTQSLLQNKSLGVARSMSVKPKPKKLITLKP